MRNLDRIPQTPEFHEVHKAKNGPSSSSSKPAEAVVEAAAVTKQKKSVTKPSKSVTNQAHGAKSVTKPPKSVTMKKPAAMKKPAGQKIKKREPTHKKLYIGVGGQEVDTNFPIFALSFGVGDSQ